MEGRKPLTYESAGVKGLGKDKSAKNFSSLHSTHVFAKGRLVQTPFGILYEVSPGVFNAKCCDGVGTKTLVAELAGKHDTIGIDAVAMVANDCIRTGAFPYALTNVIDASDPSIELVSSILQGLAEGARQAECPIVGGETASMPDMLSGYFINCDCVGEVKEGQIIDGGGIEPGDAIVGLRSSGVHSNGISLARHALFSKWGGKYGAFEKVDGLERELALEVLTPTRIYVKAFKALVKKVRPKAAVHITGDAYSKFLSSFGGGKLGFEFDNFSPQPIFEVIREAGEIGEKEMFRRFNMGWGFAVIVAKEDAPAAVGALNAAGEQSEIIGGVDDSGRASVTYGMKQIVL
ncbi:phosphoribosylformylglycinamidine cyclo-ligase [Candidatus Micrarchaeota archaeon]|nr:phosphoribosylformylglycinamidine cyclo-ligase [Candidatus Micrarchaeota archaeon]MBI5177318.1 phosphoribosylformylglycinamidine cyclo-ligase [Candidatus Micrarchaeota archaeon]